MIYQSGYLTIKDYDMDFNTFLLDFPNNEVKNGFLTVLATSYLKPSEETGGWIREVGSVRCSHRSWQVYPIRCAARRMRPSVSVISSILSI